MWRMWLRACKVRGMAEQTLDELRQEVHRLQEEQQKLKEQIKTDAPKNGAKPATAEPEEKEAKKEEEKEDQPKPPMKERAAGFVKRHPRGLLIGAVLLAVVAIAGFFLIRYFESYESTDDAFIDGNLDPIGTRIAATVTAVHVQNDQFVQAGEVAGHSGPARLPGCARSRRSRGLPTSAVAGWRGKSERADYRDDHRDFGFHLTSRCDCGAGRRGSGAAGL